MFGIGVLIDFHATNGSQNGFDHSAPCVVNGNGQQLWDTASQADAQLPGAGRRSDHGAGRPLWQRIGAAGLRPAQ